MKLATLLIATAAIAFHHPLLAALVWTVSIALWHAIDEGKGKLWVYFGVMADFTALTKVNSLIGFTLIVAPALILQCVAAYLAFTANTVNVFWLAVLIGARLGDAVISHAMPFAQAFTAEAKQNGVRTELNPGLATAAIYLVDGLLLALIFSVPLGEDQQHTIAGFASGAAFFALVLPSLRVLGRLTGISNTTKS